MVNERNAVRYVATRQHPNSSGAGMIKLGGRWGYKCSESLDGNVPANRSNDIDLFLKMREQADGFIRELRERDTYWGKVIVSTVDGEAFEFSHALSGWQYVGI